MAKKRTAKKKVASSAALVPTERTARIASSIHLIRGERVMLDADLAELYQVLTKNLVKAVKRNIERFQPRYMFQLSKEEFDNLRELWALFWRKKKTSSQ